MRQCFSFLLLRNKLPETQLPETIGIHYLTAPTGQTAGLSSQCLSNCRPGVAPSGDLTWGSAPLPSSHNFLVEFNSFVIVASRPSVSRGHSHKSLKKCELPYRDRKHISDSPGKKKLDYKGVRKHFERHWFVHYLGWRMVNRCICMLKFIKPYTLNRCSVLYVNYNKCNVRMTSVQPALELSRDEELRPPPPARLSGNRLTMRKIFPWPSLLCSYCI